MNCFNYLPPELIRKIFKKLNLNDLIKLRDVDKRFKLICDNIKIDRLYVSDRFRFYSEEKSWFYTNHSNYNGLDNNNYNYGEEKKNTIKISKFLNYKSIFQLDKTLIRLSILLESNFNLSILNEFNLLEKLYIKEYRLSDNYTLTLKNLKIFAIGLVNKSRFKLILSTNQLFAFKLSNYYFDAFKEIVFNYPDKILFFETNSNKEIFENIKNFKNLEYLKLIDVYQLNRNILSEFKNLKNFDFNLFENCYDLIIDEQNFNNLKRDINFIITEKANLKRSDFQIFFNGVKLNNRKIINQLEWSNLSKELKYNIFEFQLNNYNLLKDYCSYTEEINYCDLIKFNEIIPLCFINKFTFIKSIYVNDYIDNEDQLVKFLNKLSCLLELKLINCELTKSFYDKLINFVYLNNCLELEINDKIDLALNFDFILNFKKLRYFKTNQKLDNFDVINKLFKENKNIIQFEFKLDEKNYIQIGRDFNNFMILSFYLDDNLVTKKNFQIKIFKFKPLHLELKNIKTFLNLFNI